LRSPNTSKNLSRRSVVLIPALNEASTITSVVQGVLPYGTPLVVSDGSSDDTAELARAAGAEVVELPKNRGYERALDVGFSHAVDHGASEVITFDADGQFDSEILGVVKAAMSDPDVRLVIGIRPEFARFGEWLFGMYTQMRFGVSDILCGVKGYSVSLQKEYGRFGSGSSVGTELALYGLRRNVRFVKVPAPVRSRFDSASRFGFGWRANKQILHALWHAVYDDLAALWPRK
jgi:glycosyltransferase involved in cell wall biosynthesis